MAFIEVVTRCYKRPEMLKINTASLDRQTFKDWEQTLLIDEVGQGMTWANAQLASFEPEGEYVWILDDDDVAVRSTLFGEVAEIIKREDADMVMVKMDHAQRGILPNPWGAEPIVGRIGSSAAFIRREIWNQCKDAWLIPAYTADGEFMRRCFWASDCVWWHNVVGSKVQRISLGEPA